MADHRTARLNAAVKALLSHAESIADILLTTRAGDIATSDTRTVCERCAGQTNGDGHAILCEHPTPTAPKVAGGTTSNPTLGRIMVYDGWLRSACATIDAFLDDLDAIASRLGIELERPPKLPRTEKGKVITDAVNPDNYLSPPTDQQRMPRPWEVITAAALDIQDAWTERHSTSLAAKRRIVDIQDAARAEADLDADEQLLWLICDASRHAGRIVTQLRPKAPEQKPLVYCRNHPTKLAKYRRLELCDACYKSQSRNAS